jgi:hypothetical protein
MKRTTAVMKEIFWKTEFYSELDSESDTGLDNNLEVDLDNNIGNTYFSLQKLLRYYMRWTALH